MSQFYYNGTMVLKGNKKSIRIMPFIVISLSMFISCGDFSCRERVFYSSLREVKTSDSVIAELHKKIDKELKKSEDRQRKTQILDWYEQLGERYLQARAWDRSIEYLEKAITSGRNAPNIHYLLGLAYANRGKDLGKSDDFSAAELHYRRSLEFGLVNNDSAYALAILLYYQGERKNEAVRLMEEYVKANKKSYQGRFGLARMYYEMGDLNRTLAVYEDLCPDLDRLSDSPMTKEYQEACHDNRQRVSQELSGSK